MPGILEPESKQKTVFNLHSFADLIQICTGTWAFSLAYQHFFLYPLPPFISDSFVWRTHADVLNNISFAYCNKFTTIIKKIVRNQKEDCSCIRGQCLNVFKIFLVMLILGLVRAYFHSCYQTFWERIYIIQVTKLPS